MIRHRDEYAKMARLEGQLWWYRSLHERVETALRGHFGNRRDIRLLDAGCGTGGLLAFLRARGYAALHGVDGSPDAVAYCHQRNLPVQYVDLKHLRRFEPDETFDAIVCNDVFCYFADPDLLNLLAELTRRLRPGGLLISNNNAFNVFWGQHDLAVGSQRRFVRADFERWLPTAGLRLASATYWSFVLSPLILAARLAQRLQLRLSRQAAETPRSDVYLPGAWLNRSLYRLVRAESRLLPRTPFGSSLFITGCKEEREEGEERDERRNE